MKKVCYEYVINNTNSYGDKIKLATREEAREAKRELKSFGVDARIIQRKYILQEQKEIR